MALCRLRQKAFKAPSVIVNFTNDPDLKSGKKFAEQGLQIAAGVPLEVGEPDDYMSFRIGLFGLDKLMNIDRTVASFEDALKENYRLIASPGTCELFIRTSTVHTFSRAFGRTKRAGP